MKRVFLALLVAGVLFAAVYASAATLGVEDGVLQAGVDADMQCDTDGVTVKKWLGYSNINQDVKGVRITGIDPICNGQTIVVGIYEDDGAWLDSEATKVVDGETMDFYWDPPVTVDKIEQLHVGIYTDIP
jgi:hypothetical protein